MDAQNELGNVVMTINPFAYTLADTALRTQRIQFELQFNLLQNNLIGRFNNEVDEISQTPSSVQRKIDGLVKRQESLIGALPSLQEFRQGNLNTGGTLELIFDEITTLFSTFNGDANVDAAEVEAFNAQRDKVANQIENLFVFSHPDLNNANVIANLKDDVAAIRGLTLSVGTLDSNSAVSDSLTALQSEVSVAITVTANTIATTLDLEQKIQGDFANTDVDLLALTSEEQARREDAISSAETDLGNLLRAISISFEINSGLGEALTNRLKPFTPPPGSALNIIS